MKTTILTIFIIASLSTSAESEFLRSPLEWNDRVEVIFNRKMSFDELVGIRGDLKKKGIDLDFKELIFDKYQKLKTISFHVNCNDGFSGGAGTVTLGVKDFGFFRDYDKKVKVPFAVGNLTDMD